MVGQRGENVQGPAIAEVLAVLELGVPLFVRERRDTGRGRVRHGSILASVDACVFCAIVARSVPAAIVLDDDVAVGFLDHRPLFKGHVLVVPRVHVETLPDLEPVGPLFARVSWVARVFVDGLGADGSFVAVNNTVSKSVPHLHVHVVPRRRGDGLRGFMWPRLRYADANEMEEYASRLRDLLKYQTGDGTAPNR